MRELITTPEGSLYLTDKGIILEKQLDPEDDYVRELDFTKESTKFVSLRISIEHPHCVLMIFYRDYKHMVLGRFQSVDLLTSVVNKIMHFVRNEL